VLQRMAPRGFRPSNPLFHLLTLATNSISSIITVPASEPLSGKIGADAFFCLGSLLFNLKYPCDQLLGERSAG
jgi:hypothetical protein